MDKEQARFILQSFRPDGADAGDKDFAEALQLAVENRELGEWLAHERAFDAAFAKALNSVNLPEHLREDILGCLAVERGDFPQAEDAGDAAWIGALASIKPPSKLRDEVLAAMDRTVAQKNGKISIFKRFAIPLAAAAGIAFAFLVTRPAHPGPVARINPISVEGLRTAVVRTLEDHVPEHPFSDRVAMIQHLKEHKLPCPSGMPPGLEKLPGFGCRELVIDGKRGSLICFNRGKNGLVHLVVFRRQDLQEDFPDKGHPQFVQSGDWACARWADGDNVVMMVSHTKVENLTTLF